MNDWQTILQEQPFRYLDQTSIQTFQNTSFTALTSFAMDDALAESAGGADTHPAVRFWRHERTVVLGILDAQLPHLGDGIDFIRSHGWDVVIRNSGGLAVALDEGVLNISLIIGNVKQISIHDCYKAMVALIRSMFRDVTDGIRAYEITGSYCPGDYDLSIDGKKFAGISQRRIKNSTAVQIYLDVHGDSHGRAAFIRDFYKHGKKDSAVKFSYPDVIPETMASLSTLLQRELTVDDVKHRALQTLYDLGHPMVERAWTEEEISIYQRRLARMKERNAEI